MCEQDFAVPVGIARLWLSGEHRECASWLVADYVSCFRGRRFDELATGAPVDAITQEDLKAVRALSIGFPGVFVQKLEQDNVRRQIREMLVKIPSDAVLEDLTVAEFDEFLGPRSPAWKAWDELSGLLKDAKARAPLVGASKLLAAKRPLLIPLEDSYVRRALKTPRLDIWKAVHRVVRDPLVRDGLEQVRSAIPSASPLTLHRILDVIAWRKQQGHCCRTEPRA